MELPERKDMNNQRNIVCNIDNKYAKYCGVMLTSLFENNKEEEITVHILGVDLSQESKDTLSLIVKHYEQHLVFYAMGHEMLKGLPIDVAGYFTVAIYCRLFISNILPQQLDKVLYLDSDIIVRRNLNELWNTDLQDKAIACVEDMWSDKQDNYDRLQYDKKYSYFNSGVLLINLSYWRHHHVPEKAEEYIRNHPNRLIFPDQDVLNAILHNQKQLVSFSWNAQDGFYRQKRRIRKGTWSEIDAILSNPHILHYTGSKKPWHTKCMHPLKKEYFKYLDMTIWKGDRPRRKVSFQMLKSLNKLLELLRIIHPKYKTIHRR